MKKKVGGWVQLKKTEIYDNPWISVTHEEVKRPNQSEGIYGVVHFKNQAVGVIPLDEENNTWLVRQSRYALNEFTWEIPEGGSPIGEDPSQTALRELEEEVGLKAGRIELLARIHLSNSVSDEEGFVYVASDLDIGTQCLDDTEDIEVRKIHLDEAVAMVESGEITDALSVCGLLKLALKNGRSV